MSQSFRVMAAVLTLGVVTACSDSPTSLRPAEVAKPAFKAAPAPLTVANLGGSWSQTPRSRVPWFDGVSVNGYMESWYTITLQQNGGSLKGNANRFAQYFYSDGTPFTGAVSAGSNGVKVSGSVTSFTDAVITFDRNGGESVGGASYVMRISADQRSMTVVNPTPGGFQGFSR
jgi:hypothetical protein